MKAIPIKENIYWVGAIDWNLRNFHGYLTQRGSSYNAYLIVDEQITLIDTVKAYLADEMFARISSVVDPSAINNIVVNHVEMDHSGALPEVVKRAPNANIITSPKGAEGLKMHYDLECGFQTVSSGETLNLGNRNLQFLLTPMVHWPDNMIEYLPEEKILFTNDAFGQHLASSGRFDDEYPLDIVLEEAKKYYANIVLPYSTHVLKALEEAEKMDIEIIANSHGIMWKKHIPEIVASYKKWAGNATEKKAIIVYDTMWNSTEKMARAIYTAFEEKGYKTAMYNLQLNHISDIMTAVLDAEYICVGSPTLNGSIMPNVAAFLNYMTGLSPKGRKSFVFSSYGWGSQAIKQMEEILTNAKFEVMDRFKVKYIPKQQDLKGIKEAVQGKI